MADQRNLTEAIPIGEQLDEWADTRDASHRHRTLTRSIKTYFRDKIARGEMDPTGEQTVGDFIITTKPSERRIEQKERTIKTIDVDITAKG